MFRVADTIPVHGCSGVVTLIELVVTLLNDEDVVSIVIPNKQIAGEIHCNSYGHRLVEGRIGLEPAADATAAAAIIGRIIGATVREAGLPPPVIGIEAFTDGAIVLGYRYRAPSVRYFETLYAVNDALYAELKAAGIALAPPRVTVAAARA
jgi:small-conductance mechanosensitive channel